MELKQYLKIIQRRKWIIILTTVLVTFIVAVLTFLATPEYLSRTTVRIATVTNIDYTQVLMNTYARMVTSGTIKGGVRQQVGLNEPPQLSVEIIPGTELMIISAEAQDPAIAQAIAATAADLLVAQSREVYGGSGQSTAEILAAQVAQAEDELNTARAEYDQMLESSPDEQVRLDALSQSITLKERTLATLLDQYEDARIQETLLANSVSVIEPAYLPDTPSKPRVALNLVLGVVVGLISGVALGLLVDNLDTRLHTSDEIEELTQMPTIGKIPSAKDELHIARLNNGHYPQLEAFRRLRTNILTAGKQEGPQVVLLTSAQRGEGKSTVSANLAVTIAQSGRKVILVDCDMRLPTVHKVFDLPNKRGLTSVLTEEVELEDAILYSTFPRLHILTSGPLPPNPTELLGSPQMISLVRRMQEQFDFVLLDTPALLSVADAAVLAPIADSIIWVISRAQTRRGDIETVRRQLENVRARSVEVVINRSSDSSDYTAYGPESFTVN